MSAASTATWPAPDPLVGKDLALAALFLALANFLVVLDTTIANVSVSHIAGGLAVSTNEGTYVITSYAVAEAITVPLTGWLARRFGTLKAFTSCTLLFGFFSALCGFAGSLETLVIGRVLQGFAGGPLMALSQTLLMQIFPKEKQGAAIGLWSMTTLVAPVMGPIFGGYICDNWGWSFIFYINIPIALLCSFGTLNLLRRFETPLFKDKMDFVGLALLVTWVGALQLMLDEGKKYDWFESKFICLLLIIAGLGFISFLIWELTQKRPIVDLRIFRHRGYFASVLTISLAFGAFFGSVVLTPLWLQTFMGYTATWSGYATACMGILAVFVAPFAAQLSKQYDPRKLVFMGVVWLGMVTFYRSFNTTDMTYAQIAIPMLLQGIGLPFFFIPLSGLALASVKPEEVASAAGLMNFSRTLCGAFATSIVTTSWESQVNIFRTDLVSSITLPESLMGLLGNVPLTAQNTAFYLLDQLIQSQAVMLATNKIFLLVSFTFAFAACAIWLAPKPKKPMNGPAPH